VDTDEAEIDIQSVGSQYFRYRIGGQGQQYPKEIDPLPAGS